MSDATRALLCDPQTSGGLLIAAAPPAIPAVQSILQDRGLPHQVIGALQASPHPGRLFILVSMIEIDDLQGLLATDTPLIDTRAPIEFARGACRPQ